MQTINLEVKGKPLVFTNKSVTYAGHEFFYSKMSNIAHRGGSQPAYIFDYEGKRLALPYDPKYKDITLKIFKQAAALGEKRQAHPAPAAKPAAVPQGKMAYTLSFSDNRSALPSKNRPAGSPHQVVFEEQKKEKGFWSVGRFVIGILSMVLFLFIALQSFAAGISNVMADNNATSGSSGLFTAILFLIAGIVGLCTRNTRGIVGAAITAVLYFLGAILTFGTGGTYGDLPIWGGLSAIFGIVFVVCAVKTKMIRRNEE